MGTITRRNSRIIVLESVLPNDFHRLCATLHQAVRHDPRVTLDFANCGGITQAVMLPLMPLVTWYRELQDIRFEFIAPLDQTLARLFVNTNWAYHIDPDNYRPNPHMGGHVPALRFLGDGASGQEDILKRVMELILTTLDTERDTLKAVEWSLGEIMDNVPSHAESPVGGFVQATAFGESNAVEFVVADAGIGVAASMGIHDEEAALREAITEGVTRDQNRNAGNGLFGSYQVAALSGGVFEIRSNLGLLRRTGSGDLHTTRLSVPYRGTSVRCRIGLGDPGLLGRALRFKGRSHDPPFDFVEREFEGEEGTLVINMKDKASPHFGSRQGGVYTRRIIQNLLREGPYIVLDFEGVGVVTSSFADEVFGRLFVMMGPRAFMTRIRMIHVDPTVEGLIDRAILQRARLGNRGSQTE